MHVMFHHQNARIALVVVVSLSLLTTGCRSTRNGLSGIPGMSWLAAEEVPSWGSDSEEPGLPPPSSEATPQLTTTNTNSDAKANQDYPDTGYPSPYGEDSQVVRSGGSYPTGHFDKSNAVDANEDVEAATVGNTQQGFYGDDYSDDSQSVDGDLPPNDNYDQYADSYSDQGYGSDASDADGQFEQRNDGRIGQAEVDPYDRDAQGDLSMPEETNNGLRDGYDRFSQGIRDGAEAIADGAERMGDRVQGFAREQGDNIRSTVRDGYDRMNLPPNDLSNQPVDDSYADDPAIDSGDPQTAGPDAYADDAYSDYPAETPAEDGYSDYPQDNYDDYPRDSYGQTTDPTVSSPDQGPAASLNPPNSDGYDRPNDLPGVDQNAPRRSVQPWRPGSTGTFRSSGVDPRSRSYQDTSAVAPASFPGRTTDSLQPQARPSDYPDQGWQSHNEESTQRLSPTYR
jgi:hypothetical protein